MTVEVFQWRVTPEGRLNKAVSDVYFDIMMGDAAVIESAIKKAPSWDALGLFIQKVAEVEGDNMGNAFRLTNHIESDWTKNEGVSAMGNGQWRSTSVGDVMRVEGVLHAVSNIGFQKLGDCTIEALPAPVKRARLSF